MAEIHSTVKEAETAMWGPTAEAQALVDLCRTADCDAESVSTLALGILERYVQAWQNLSHELIKHRRPSHGERGVSE